MRDFYSNEIAPGARVAFNLSGEVRIGFIDEVKTQMRYGRLSDLIIVNEVGTNKKSKVTSRRNLVVLNEAVRED